MISIFRKLDLNFICLTYIQTNFFIQVSSKHFSVGKHA